MRAEREDFLLDSVLIPKKDGEGDNGDDNPDSYPRYADGVNGGRESSGVVSAYALRYKEGEFQEIYCLIRRIFPFHKIKQNIERLHFIVDEVSEGDGEGVSSASQNFLIKGEASTKRIVSGEKVFVLCFLLRRGRLLICPLMLQTE